MSKRVVVLDFETYYDTDYSLSKMTTEDYIRDPRFEVLGVAAKIDDAPAFFIDGVIAADHLKRMELDKAFVIAHNSRFDMTILSWIYGIYPEFIFDTMSMARPLVFHKTGSVSLRALCDHFDLGEKGYEVLNTKGKRRADFTSEEFKRLAEYGKKDAELTRALFNKLAPGFPQTELRVIDRTIRMYSEPIFELDKDVLVGVIESERARKQALMDRIAGVDKALLMSNEKFASLLRFFGVEPPRKVSKATGKPTFAFSKTDAAFTALLDDDNEYVAALVSARLGVKSTIVESRAERMLAIANRGLLPAPLQYYAAHTGRYGGDDKINLQNLTKGSGLRAAIRAPKGYVIIAADLSQIEARLLAWFAGQMDLVEQFALGADVYSAFATKLYGESVVKGRSKLDDERRKIGKICILGLGYGLGPDTFFLQLQYQGIKDVTPGMARDAVSTYRETFPRIAKVWWKANDWLSIISGSSSGWDEHKCCEIRRGGISLPSGLALRYHDLKYTSSAASWTYRYGKKTVYLYGSKVIENIIQALASIIIREAMVILERRGLITRLQVHDELVFVVPEKDVDDAKREIGAVMRRRPKWAPDLPVEVEIGVGYNYKDVK